MQKNTTLPWKNYIPNGKDAIVYILLFISIIINILYISGSEKQGGKHNYQQHESSYSPMEMTMQDMTAMLVGKTGDDLNRAFLEGMIPHHQAAVDMAAFLAGSNKPELVKLGGEIITTQSAEIEQMKQWMIDWGYTTNNSTSTGMMHHSTMTPQM